MILLVMMMSLYDFRYALCAVALIPPALSFTFSSKADPAVFIHVPYKVVHDRILSSEFVWRVVIIVVAVVDFIVSSSGSNAALDIIHEAKVLLVGHPEDVAKALPQRRRDALAVVGRPVDSRPKPYVADEPHLMIEIASTRTIGGRSSQQLITSSSIYIVVTTTIIPITASLV